MSDEDCGCCEGAQALTPVGRANPPGQASLRYRVGTHGRFLASQLTALGSQPPLRGLSTRDADDPALALLDAWSAVLDVLGFYQERIANEGYLRTATERLSVLQLGRAIGYELRPGVAASTFLAFTLETAPGAPAQVYIDTGLKTQSIPEQDQQAQVFETLEPLQARAAWNALEVLNQEALPPYWGGRTLYLRGQSTGLQPGDALLVVGDERLKTPGSENWDFRRVTRVQVVAAAEPSGDPLAGYSMITLDHGLGSAVPHVEPAKQNPRIYALRTRAALFGHAAPDWRAMPRSLRASYLGSDEPTTTNMGLHREWPGYTLSDISDPPGSLSVGSGLYGEYFDTLNFSHRKMTRTDASIDFAWGAASPDASLSGDTFSVRWTGWVQIPSSGAWTFYVTADDGVRLWVNGQLLVDQWKDQGATEYSAPLSLTGGSKVDIRLEYYENGGSATVQLRWSGPGVTKQIIPQEYLYPRDVHTVHLDACYPKLVAGSWVVMAIPEYQELYQVLDNREDARAAFTLSAKTSRLSLRGENLRELFNERLRDTALYGESVELQWATRPVSGFIQGHLLSLATLQPELKADRWLAFGGLTLSDWSGNAKARQRLLAGDTLAALEVAKNGIDATLSFADGERHALRLVFASEVRRLRRNDNIGGRSRLELDEDLSHAYLPLTLRINANVALASHGDSKQMRIQPEVLGSGDGSRAFQRFLLRQKPLTYIAAATPSGTASTLEVRVDGLLWHEAPRLGELHPEDRAYLVRQADDGSVTLQFGDGEHGSRLPSGQMNVAARYRVGIGAAGNLKAGQISLLLNRPLGLKEVINPVPAAGGSDPEGRERARQNAPLTVLALDRIVSLRDFEDFARAFAGIGKAQAVWLWNGEGRLVHLTVIGADGTDIAPDSTLYRNLAAAIDAVRPRYQPLRLEPGVRLRFGLSAKLRVNPDYESEAVLAAVRTALSDTFGFSARGYGQSLNGSELIAVMQRVAGVERIDLDNLRLYEGALPQTFPGPTVRLPVRGARWEGGQIRPAQLLLIDPTDIQLTELSS